MRDIQIQAARDALAELGGPVQFTAGEYSAEISAHIRPDVTDFDELGNMVVMTTLRAVSADMPGLGTGSTFQDESGQLYKFMATLKHDGITRLCRIGKTSAGA